MKFQISSLENNCSVVKPLMLIAIADSDSNSDVKAPILRFPNSHQSSATNIFQIYQKFTLCF